MFAFGKRNATTTTTTRLSSITDQDNLSRSYSTTSTAVPPSLFSNDGASILTELPDYADIYVRGRQPAIGLATNFAFPRATNMSLVQDWTKSNVDWDLFFYETTNMILRIEGKVYTLRHQVELINAATRLPVLHLRQDIPAIGLDFKLYAPSPTDPHDIIESSPLASIVVRSGGLRGKPFRDTLEMTFHNTAAQPFQNGTSTAKDKTVRLLTELNGFKDMSGDVVRVDEEAGGREIVVGRIVRQLISAEERIDVQAAAGVDVRMLVVLALCMKYRRRNA